MVNPAQTNRYIAISETPLENTRLRCLLTCWRRESLWPHPISEHILHYDGKLKKRLPLQEELAGKYRDTGKREKSGEAGDSWSLFLALGKWGIPDQYWSRRLRLLAGPRFPDIAV